MRNVNFNDLGGFPLTQDTLSWLQGRDNEIINAFGKIGKAVGNTDPIVLYGCYKTGATTVSEGYIFYNGEVLYFPGGDYGALGSGSTCRIKSLSTTVVFEDLSTKTAYTDKSIEYGNDAFQFDILTIKRYAQQFGTAGYESTETSVVISGGAANANGTIYYRKNHLANLLHIRGDLVLTSTDTLTNPPIYFNMMTLPAGYRPAAIVPFKVFVRYHNPNYIKEVNSIDYLKDMNAEVRTDGNLNIGFIRSEAAVNTYTVSFNTVIPLI